MSSEMIQPHPDRQAGLTLFVSVHDSPQVLRNAAVRTPGSGVGFA